MNEEYYKSDQLVGLIHASLGGFHPGFRAVHALGRLYLGNFTATPQAQRYTRAIHMQGQAVPATVRYSYASGDPEAPSTAGCGMATKFYLPNGQVTDLVALSVPHFPYRTPGEVLEILTLVRPDPATGKPDQARLQAWVIDHPGTARALQINHNQPAPLSLAQSAYHAVHAFRFVNANDEARYARYHWMPEEGIAGETLAELHQRGHTYLFDEFENRLRQASVAYRLVLELAEEGDPLDDGSAPWPREHTMVTIGRLALTRPTSTEEIGDPIMLHDPTRVTDGIEISDDPILAARRGVYEASVAHRTGGWKGREGALESFRTQDMASTPDPT